MSMDRTVRRCEEVGEPSIEELDERRIEAAVQLARGLVDEAAVIDARAGRRERRRRRRLRALVRDPKAADFTVRLTDEVTRIPVARKAAERLAQLVHEADLESFAMTDRVLLRIGARVAPVAPGLVMPLVTRRLRSESAAVILAAEDPAFADHVARRRAEGVGCNVNVLGEAIIGADEARRRLDMVVARLCRPDVDYVSVKISAICPDISVLAFADTIERVAVPLRVLYRCAASFDPPKFVNLDMEEYRDLDLTVAVFRRVLDEPEFEHLDAGIVLQAYLPESRGAARELAEWAVRRHRGGGHTKIRIVKGANLAMENVEAELRGWEPAPYRHKADVDANYKAVLDILCDPAFDAAVRVGVASHNLFDIAWALVLGREMVESGRPDRLEIEMLEGMAPSQSKAVRDAAGTVILYTPVVNRSDFPAAIAYLVRRLDENTSPDNFLSHVFDLAADRTLFAIEADRFRAAVRARGHVDQRSRRRQDRSLRPAAIALETPFENAADTDWTRSANRTWITRSIESASSSQITIQPEITKQTVDECVATAVSARLSWSTLDLTARAEIINRVADVFEAQRGRLLATMVDDAAKTIPEGDPEVSEGIDFARYYAREAVRLAALVGARSAPLGTIVVAPPWNFPFAIASGGVLAALAAGNTVILKPAPQTVRTGALIAELCWNAGVPTDVLQFVPAPDGDVGRRLITHPDVDGVVLTGAYATASMFHSWRPDLRLHAETSGKNAITISATADLDHAVADLVRSAFGHAGQKCSAASLAIIEASLYDDPTFLERIRDAAATLRVGPANQLATDVGPLVDPPAGALERALTTLEQSESWLLAPECRSDDRRLWSPGIRAGVRPGSWFARTECFGPVLGLIRATDLEHAIDIQNGTDFGLTAGLHALDPAEIDKWMDRVEAGNLYVNRGTTGAVVRRQPFGGWKCSAVGPTAKAGGPNYVASLSVWIDDASANLDLVADGFEHWIRTVGLAEFDPTGLIAEQNLFRYRPCDHGVAIRFGRHASDRERALVEIAVRSSRCRTVVSDWTTESDAGFAVRLSKLGVERVRLVGAASDGSGDGARDQVVRSACHAAGLPIYDAAPVGVAQIELPRWLREQAISITAHRHGRTPPNRRANLSQ